MSTGSPSAASRARRIVIFLVVVWSIGGAFYALQAGLSELAWWWNSSAAPAAVVLPAQSQAALAHCTEFIQGLPPSPHSFDSRQTSYLAWSLGYNLGLADAAMSLKFRPRSEVEEMLQRSLPASRALGVPAPAVHQRRADASVVREFAQELEEDPMCIAAALKHRYSPRHAALYKFGVTVGFVGADWNEKATLGYILYPQLKSYGWSASVPAELYNPLRQPPVAASGADGTQAIQALAKRIDDYVAHGPIDDAARPGR